MTYINKSKLNSLKLDRKGIDSLIELNLSELYYLLYKNCRIYSNANRPNKQVERNLSKIIDAICIKKEETFGKKIKDAQEAQRLLEPPISLDHPILYRGEFGTLGRFIDYRNTDRNTANYIEIERRKARCLKNMIINGMVDETVNNGVLDSIERRVIKLKYFYNVPRKDRIKALDEVAKRDEYHASFLKKNAYASLSNAEIGRVMGRSGYGITLILRRAIPRLKAAFLKKYGKPTIEMVLQS